MMLNDSKLENAINEKDLSLVRTILINHIDTDINRNNFLSKELADSAEAELSALGIALYEDDNGKFEFLSTDSWDKDKWQTLKVEMRYNFSREKFDLIIKMIKTLRKKGDSYFQVRKSNFIKNESSTYDVKDKQEIKSSTNGFCLFGTMVAGVLIGFAVAKTLTASKVVIGISSILGGGIGCLTGIINFSKRNGEKE